MVRTCAVRTISMAYVTIVLTRAVHSFGTTVHHNQIYLQQLNIYIVLLEILEYC